MATAVQKITLSASRDIPFNKLVLSQANVRRVKAGVSIEELAEDIARRTLLQSLSVRAALDAEGQETGMFEVPAGGRRFRALELLVKQKRMAKTQPVPCGRAASAKRIRWPRTCIASPCTRSTSFAPSRPCARRG
jgi:ParB family chromosome partitioning protein